MKVERFEKQHLAAFDEAAFIDGMRGLTLLEDEPVACFGTVRLAWGEELWIVRQIGLAWGVRLRIARLIRWYMGMLLSFGEPLFAHAPPNYEHERLFSWLGLAPVGEVAGMIRWEAKCPRQ